MLPVAFFSEEQKAWKADLTALQRDQKQCDFYKDDMKAYAEGRAENHKILDWITTARDNKDPEPSQRDILRKTGMDDEKYASAGEWFLSGVFLQWIDALETAGECDADDDKEELKRVLWLKGTMGTGKTTLICKAISKLHERESPLPDNSFRVAHYYCFASGVSSVSIKPRQETIIRGLCRKLAWMSDNSLAPSAAKFYRSFGPGSKDSPHLDDWRGLLSELTQDIPESTQEDQPRAPPHTSRAILVVDALDECADDGEANEFLDFMFGFLQKNPHVYLLCSSRPNIPVNKCFKTGLLEIDALSGKEAAKKDMEIYINAHIEKRRNFQTEGSIFFKSASEQLLLQLKTTLLKSANGMFRWVSIWISILFPRRPQDQIKKKANALNMLEEIEQGRIPDHTSMPSDYEPLNHVYDRLWDSNQNVEYKALQVRLFQLVICAYIPLTLEMLRDALMIDPESEDSFDEDLSTDTVEALFFNFLVQDSEGMLIFAHESAKSYILTERAKFETPDIFSSINCHFVMSKICLQLMANIDHPAWKHGALDLRRCKEKWQPTNSMQQTEKIFIELWEELFSSEAVLFQRLHAYELRELSVPLLHQSFCFYVIACFIRHCRKMIDEAIFQELFRHLFSVMTASNSAILLGALSSRWLLMMGSYRLLRKSSNKPLDMNDRLLNLDYCHMVTLDNDNLIVPPSFFLASTGLITEDIVSTAMKQATPTFRGLDLTLLYASQNHVNYPHEHTALHLASRKGHYAAAKFFLESEIKMHRSSHTSMLFHPAPKKDLRPGWLPIHFAVFRGDMELVKLMLEYEARFAHEDSLQALFPPHVGASVQSQLLTTTCGSQRASALLDVAMESRRVSEEEIVWILDIYEIYSTPRLRWLSRRPKRGERVYYHSIKSIPRRLAPGDYLRLTFVPYSEALWDRIDALPRREGDEED